jgi:methionyl-tRNA formyltransferase
MENKSDVKIIFMGTPEFGAIILEKLIEEGYKPVLAITNPDKPVGRKKILTSPPVKLIAQEYNIPTIQPGKIITVKERIQNINPDLIVVAAFGQILPEEILQIPKYGCLNVHPSLLPRWRGASPIQFTILYGDAEAGVTIILMDGKMDHGDIISNIKYPISDIKITYKELEKDLAKIGAELLVKTIPEWIEEEIKPQPQDESEATFTKVLKREDGRIEWGKSAQDIERQIRAFDPWPASYCFWPKDSKEVRMKILRANVLEQKSHGPFGVEGKTFLAPNSRIAVQTGKDFLIIEELQMEGAKPTTSEEFLKGNLDLIGYILE